MRDGVAGRPIAGRPKSSRNKLKITYIFSTFSKLKKFKTNVNKNPNVPKCIKSIIITLLNIRVSRDRFNGTLSRKSECK